MQLTTNKFKVISTSITRFFKLTIYTIDYYNNVDVFIHLWSDSATFLFLTHHFFFPSNKSFLGKLSN